MSENLKTIKELADEFKVSKQAVRKRLTEEFRANYVETITSNGVKTLIVTNTGYMLLKQHFVTSNSSGNDEVTGTGNYIGPDVSVVKILEQQLSVKDKQIENKDIQISQMQNLLDQQQRLALQDKKLLEEYKTENDNLKALKIPSKDATEEQTNNQLPEVQNEGEELRETPKKWWQFWKE